MKEKKTYLAEQVGAFWLLSGGEIKGTEILAKLTDIPARFFDSLEIIPEATQRDRVDSILNPRSAKEMNVILDFIEQGGGAK